MLTYYHATIVSLDLNLWLGLKTYSYFLTFKKNLLKAPSAVAKIPARVTNR